MCFTFKQDNICNESKSKNVNINSATDCFFSYWNRMFMKLVVVVDFYKVKVGLID